MTKYLLALVFAAISFVTLSAHDLMVQVQADRVTIGPEFVRRDLAATNALIVPAGQSVELPADMVYDYVEVAGTLHVSRSHNTHLSVVTMLVLPSGTFDAGTVADPIPCGVRFELSFRNVPMDTVVDPFTWGHGLLNFGHQTRVGCEKTSFLEAAAGLVMGQTTIPLATEPIGWRVGDEVMLPDTDTPRVAGDGVQIHATPSRRETPVTISAIDGSILILSKPLDFAHASIVDPQGNVILRPRVANLTRNIVLSSEAVGLSGVHGHTADIGMDATWDIRANEFHELGRTLNSVLLDTNTTPPYVIGANQRGKYADHKHHTESCPTCVTEDNVYLGNTQLAKWGLALHGASDTLVKDNIVVDFPGAGIVTEDGNEVRNSFIHNLGAYIVGAPGDCCGFNGQNNVDLNAPGGEGNGFGWFRGVQNTFVANEGWNSFAGVNLFNQQFPANVGKYPSQPGIEPDTVPVNHAMQPIMFTGQVFAGNARTGLEFWAIRPLMDMELISAYNAGPQVIGVQSDGLGHRMTHPKLVCQYPAPPNTQTIGIHSSDAYTGDLYIDGGGQVAGCEIGVMHGGGKTGIHFSGRVVMQNLTNIDSLPADIGGPNGVGGVDLDVDFQPLGSNPLRTIVFQDVPDHGVTIWHKTEPLPAVGVSHVMPARGSGIKVRGYLGQGDFSLFYPEALGSNDAWYSAGHQHRYNCPFLNMTVMQCYIVTGLAWGGEALADADVVHLDGLINGLARRGLGINYGPPRALVTFPTMREAVLGPDGQQPSNTGYTYISAAITGDPSLASDIMVYSVDNDPLYAWGSQGESNTHLDTRDFNSPHWQPGLHTVSVWRTAVGSTYANYTLIPESKWTSTFFIGDQPPPPCTTCECNPSLCPPPPPVLVAVPNVVGMPQATATNAIIGAGLIAGTVVTAPSSTTPVGQVISETPAAGSNVTRGTVVMITVAVAPLPPVETTTVMPVTIQRIQQAGVPDRWRLCVGTSCTDFPQP